MSDWSELRSARRSGLSWSELCGIVPELSALDDCPQEPDWHAEGDVGIHTRMVLDWLLNASSFDELDEDDADVVFVASLLHDIAKPLCTRKEEGRWTARGHSRRGAQLARRILWELGMPPQLREETCGLILNHQLPFFLIEKEDDERRLVDAAEYARPQLLAIVAEADARGRRCEDQQRLIDNVELFRERARELDCWTQSFAFENDQARLLYFRDRRRHLFSAAHPAQGSVVTLMSGLPASGKDHWLSKHAPDLPMISLDELRKSMKVAATDDQGRVLQAAREQARVFLRQSAPFAWNATNLSRRLRDGLIGLFLDYDAQVRIVALECGPKEQARRMRERRRIIPASALARMVDQWSVPTRHEAQEAIVDES